MIGIPIMAVLVRRLKVIAMPFDIFCASSSLTSELTFLYVLWWRTSYIYCGAWSFAFEFYMIFFLQKKLLVGTS